MARVRERLLSRAIHQVDFKFMWPGSPDGVVHTSRRSVWMAPGLLSLAGIVEDRRHVTLHSHVRISACSCKGAGRFMIVLPAHKHPDLLLTPEQCMDNVQLRFGLELSRRLHDEHTACGCGVRPSQFSCVQEFFDHILGCKKGAKGTTLNHTAP